MISLRNKYVLKVILAVGTLLVSTALHSQDQDSIRYIPMSEVKLSAKKESRLSLLRFYKSGKLSTTEEILGRMPNLSLVRRGSYGQEALVRGMGGGQVHVLIDGMRMFGACTDKMDPPTIYIEPSNLKSIQSASATQDLSFGSTIGGVLNMKTLDPVVGEEQKFSGQWNVAYQSVSNAIQTGGNIQYSAPRDALQFSGVYRKHNNYKDGNGNTVRYTGYEKWNASLGYLHQRKNGHTLQIQGLLDEGRDIGYAALPMDVGFASAKMISASYGINNHHGSGSQLKFKAYYNQVDHAMDDTKRPDVPMHMDMPGESRVSGFYTELQLGTHTSSPLDLRMEWYRHNSSASMTMYSPGAADMYMLTLPDNRRDVFNLNARKTWTLDTSNQLILSVSGDLSGYALLSEMGKQQWTVFGHDGENQHRYAYSFNTAWWHHFSSQWSTRLTAGRGERMATPQELYGYYLFNRLDGYDYIGNPELRNESSWNAEAMVRFKNKKVQINAQVFMNRLFQYVYGKTVADLSVMTPGANGVKQWENISDAWMTGAEGTVVVIPVQNLMLLHTSRYLYGWRDEGTPLPQVAPYKSFTSLRYSRKQWNLQLENEWAAAQHQIDPEMGEDATDAYMLFHLRGQWQMPGKWEALTFSLAIENLLDTYYHEHLDWGNIPRPGRNVTLGLNVTF